MTREEAHKLIDQLFDSAEPATNNLGPGVELTFQEPKKLPEGKRVVRTNTSGDRVYLLDEVKKTRQWVATGEVLTALGYDQADVQDVSDTDLYKYSMGATIYKVD